jgi:hypothetical protein
MVTGCVTAGAVSAAPISPLRVATFHCEVTPPPGEGLIWNVPLSSVQEPLWAKGIVLEDRHRRYVICAIDWCEICNESQLAFRKAIARAARTRVSCVTLHSVHQHAAPYADLRAHELLDTAPNPPLHLSDQFLRQTEKRLSEAVRASLRRLEPFDRVGIGQAKVDRVASTRRLCTPDGKILVRYSAGGKDAQLAAAPEGLIDPVLRTITLAHRDAPLVRLHFYATHPQTFACDGRASSDFVGQARETLEQREQVPQIYFTGCAGDVTVGKYNDGTPRAQLELAERLRAGMEAAIASTVWAPATSLRWRTVPLVLPLRTDPGFKAADCLARVKNPKADPGLRVYQGAIRLAFAERIRRPLTMFSLQIGNIQILQLPGEPMLEFQFYAQGLRPDRFIAVAGYNDCGPGYICTDRAFAEGGYEPTDANVGPGSERLLKEALARLLDVR